MEIYFDNAATTKVSKTVAEKMMEMMLSHYGNPSSMHKKGFMAEQAIKASKEVLASSMKVDSSEVVFTSGGTEANNLAILGSAFAKQRLGKHLITTVFEHPSVLEPMRQLEKYGFEVTYLPVEPSGRVAKDVLVEAVREDTIFVSVLSVQNELGVVQDIAGLSKAVKAKNKKVLFHTDAVQAFGKLSIYPKREGIDLLSLSGHKLHGPKGSGALYIEKSVKIHPLLFGGGQQKGLRSGTENVPAIVGLAEAVKEYEDGKEAFVASMNECRMQFIEGMQQKEGVFVNDFFYTAPHIVSVSFEGIKSEVLLHALEEYGIFVSSGSACASNHPGISESLKAVGVKKQFLDSTLRFSFSRYSTKEEVATTLEILDKLLPSLQKFRRK